MFTDALVNGDGEEVAEKDVLQATDQQLTKELDTETLSANFALKVQNEIQVSDCIRL